MPTALPYASDVLYHDRIIYFAPTGIDPEEWSAVAGFPAYCIQHRVNLPRIALQMCKGYFESSRLAADAVNVIRPLQPDKVLLVIALYGRDLDTVSKAEGLLDQHSDLANLLPFTDGDLPFISRELMSHLFADPDWRTDYRKPIQYLTDEAGSPEHFVRLIAAVMVNRLRLFVGHEPGLLMSDHNWYPFVIRGCEALRDHVAPEVDEVADSDAVELMSYKLFETILTPLFGRVDTAVRAESVAHVASTLGAEVAAFKSACRRISTGVVTSGTCDSALRTSFCASRFSVRWKSLLHLSCRSPRRMSQHCSGTSSWTPG